MTELEILYIAVGLVTSLLFSEVLGLAPGGIIVPGYLAMYAHQPLTIALTFAVAYVTYFVVYVLGTVTIIYGRRRTVMTIVVAFFLGWVARSGVLLAVAPPPGTTIDVVGYIIPGLIAIWIDRQGALVTFSASITAAIAVRLMVIVAMGV